MRQDADGCDYTIGCAEKLIPLQSQDMKDVPSELEMVLDYHDAFQEERLLKDVKLFLESSVNAKEIYSTMLESHQTARDLAEYERLKKKFG
jgi:hypothetical protein